MIFLELFFRFFKAGLFAVGGGSPLFLSSMKFPTPPVGSPMPSWQTWLPSRNPHQGLLGSIWQPTWDLPQQTRDLVYLRYPGTDCPFHNRHSYHCPVPQKLPGQHLYQFHFLRRLRPASTALIAAARVFRTENLPAALGSLADRWIAICL